MALKPKAKRRIIWGAIVVIATLMLALILVPPMLNLNSLKPKLESAIYRQTGVAAQIKGDVHFSLMYHATIVAHDVKIDSGDVRMVMFSVPLWDIFHLERAPLDGDITVSGANVVINELLPVDFNHSINITNSRISFLDKDYDIIRGTISSGRFVGNVRTDQHKYDIEFENDEFIIRNRTNSLNIIGQLYSDGTARGELAISTDNVNRWFDFSQPHIDRHINMVMNFDWDGGYGFEFTNIRGNGFSGNIKLYPDGRRDIKLSATDLDYDFSFLLNPMQIFYDTSFDLDFYGDLHVGSLRFSHLKFVAVGTRERIQISSVIADNIAMAGGYIDENGAHGILISMPLDGVAASCVFTGTPNQWRCENFTWGNMSGTIAVDGDDFVVSVTSPDRMPTLSALRANARRLAPRGVIDFRFEDAAGRMVVDEDIMRPEFTYAKNKTLSWAGIDMQFLPRFITDAYGDFVRAGNVTTFRPISGGWDIAMTDNGAFVISGDNYKQWFEDMDLRALAGLPYSVSGRYAGGAISDLRIEIGGQVFTGRVVDGTITLATDMLNLDAFSNQDFVDNYEEMEFLTMNPVFLPFGLGVDVALSADTVVYDGDIYSNFIYSLKRGVQTFSITDDARGNLLAIISRAGTRYEIAISVADFKIAGNLLAANMPLNVRDTRITGEIDMVTSGQIAHDISYNMTGDIDLVFDGGYIVGIGIDDFYASADSITKMNAEYVLANTFEGGETRLKKMTISGHYENGKFDTTTPLSLLVPHADAAGQIQVADGKIAARLRLVLRGTAPDPAPIEVEILGNGKRNYSFSQIMMNFDPAYLREFIRTHDRF